MRQNMGQKMLNFAAACSANQDRVLLKKPGKTTKGLASGFTLVELMIVVSIIGILAAIAIPAYGNYIIKANRAAVQSYMLEIASKQEQFILDARAYSTVADPASTAAGGLNVPYPDNVTANYGVAVATDNSTTPPSYTITATPVAGSRQAGDGNLTLNQAGLKSPAAKW